MQSIGILRVSGRVSMMVRSKETWLLLSMILVFSAASVYSQCSAASAGVKNAWSDGPTTYPEPGCVHRANLLPKNDCDAPGPSYNEPLVSHTIYTEAPDGLESDQQWATFIVTDGSCCAGGSVGNVDASADLLVTMGDLTALIDHLFISMVPLACPDEGNVDMSSDGLITMGDLTVLINHLFISLAPLPPCPEHGAAPVGILTGHGSCKTGKGTLDDPTSSEDCVDWSFEDGTLSINHINAGFNCCPIILADITIEGNLITISEIDSLDGGGCDCNCLFDVNYEITGLQAGVYHLVVDEPYRQNPDEPIDFMLDLSATPSGRHCEDRTVYPWGEL